MSVIQAGLVGGISSSLSREHSWRSLAGAAQEQADRLGFLVLGVLRQELPLTVGRLAAHPSCLGWLLPPGVPVPGGLPAGTLVGAELDEAHPAPPAGAAFVVASAELAAQGSLPALVRGEGEVPGVCLGRLG